MISKRPLEAFENVNDEDQSENAKSILKRFSSVLKTVEQAKRNSQRYTEQFTRLVEDFEQQGEIISNAVEAKFLHQMSNIAEKTLTKELQFSRADIKKLKADGEGQAAT